MKIKTSELIGPALDWVVATADGMAVSFGDWYHPDEGCSLKVARWPAGSASLHRLGGEDYSPSTDWSQGGPIIEREGILVGTSPFPQGVFAAGAGNEWGSCEHICTGPTPLIAAMRCYVASKLGDNIDIPEELR